MTCPMKTKPVVAFYDDSTVFGGHEVLSAAFANALSTEYEVHFFFWHPQVGELLAPGIARQQVTVRTVSPLAGLRNWNISDILEIKKDLNELSPALCVVCQGVIDSCTKGVVAARLAGIPCASYIPSAGSYRDLGAKLPLIRDTINRIYYALPDSFITNSEAQKANVERWIGCRRPVWILNNIVDFGALDSVPAKNMAAPVNIGVVGRLDVKVKGQDRAVAAFAGALRKGLNASLYIIGDGPDRKCLTALVTNKNIAHDVHFTGWLRSKEEIYNLNPA